MEPPKVQCTSPESTFACFSFALKQPAALTLGHARCRAIFYTPTCFAFGNQRFLRWAKPGQGAAFIPFAPLLKKF